MKTKRVGRGDLLLIAALLIAGLVMTAVLHGFRQDGRQVIVRVDGQIVARIALSADGEYPVEVNGEITNLLAVQDGAVRMEEAECPDHLCIRRGAIRYAGDSIVCLPNRVVAEITGEDALDLDAVVG